MIKKCLYCYQKLDKQIEGDFHQHCSIEFFGSPNAPTLSYSMPQMSKLAQHVIERSVAVPGVQAKLSLSLVNDTLKDGGKGRLTVVGALGGNYILKPPSELYPQMPQNEHLTMRIAQAFGIQTVKSSLIRLQSGELSYITKRIDRKDNGKKIHMLDLFQVTEAIDKYKSSMERVGKAIAEHSSNTLLDTLYFFEISLFSFLTGNNDMHLKNFSLISSHGEWALAPAYDLLNVVLLNPADTEELALTLQGKKKKLKRDHFVSLGQTLDLNEKQIQNVFTRFTKNKVLAEKWIQQSFLTKEHKERYLSILDLRYSALKG